MDVREKLVEMLQVDLSGSDGYEPELSADYMLDNLFGFEADIKDVKHTLSFSCIYNLVNI